MKDFQGSITKHSREIFYFSVQKCTLLYPMTTNWLFLARGNFSEEYVAATTMCFQELIGLQIGFGFGFQRLWWRVPRRQSSPWGAAGAGRCQSFSLSTWRMRQELVPPSGEDDLVWLPSPLSASPACCHPSLSGHLMTSSSWAATQATLEAPRRAPTQTGESPLGIFQFLMLTSDW